MTRMVIYEAARMKTLTIGKVAKQAQVRPETIRYYERQGLLDDPPRSDGGFRLYTEETVRRIRFIRHAKQLGFTLREIRELLAFRDDPNMDCAEVCDRAERKIADINRRIEELTRIREVLEGLVCTCTAGTPIGDCPILNAMKEDAWTGEDEGSETS